MNHTITELIQEFGIESARAYLLHYFQDENNLKYFASIFSDHIEPPLPEYQKDLYTVIPEFDRIALSAPRGSGKSTTVNIVILAYYSLFKKSPFSVLVSDTLDQARRQLEALAHELENNEMIRFLFGEVRGSVWGADSILIKTKFGESLIIAKGANQSIRGIKFRENRPHLVVIDDLENDELVESDERRNKLENWFRFNLLRGLAKKWNKVIYLGTILHERALLKKIIDNKEPYQAWKVMNYPAIKTDGTSFWETNFPLKYLIAIRDNPEHPEYCGSIVFAQEYQNQPRSDKDRIIQEGWLQYYNYNHKYSEEWIKTLTIIGGVDPAISKEDTACFFSFTTIGVDKEGHIWILEIVRGKFSILEQITEILNCYKRWKHNNIGIESIAYQKALSQLVKSEGAKMGVYPKIKEIFTDKDKTRRLVAVSAMFEGGFIHIDKNSKESDNLVKEIREFPSKPNDSIDSLILALETNKKPRVRVFSSKPEGF